MRHVLPAEQNAECREDMYACLPCVRLQEVQRGKQLAERAQSTSKLLREDIDKGVRRASRTDGFPMEPNEEAAGVADLAKRQDDYAAAFAQISTATGTPLNCCVT